MCLGPTMSNSSAVLEEYVLLTSLRALNSISRQRKGRETRVVRSHLAFLP